MPVAAVSTAPLNPSAVNPPVALTTGLVQDGRGVGGVFILSIPRASFMEAAMTTVITGAPTSVVAQLQGSIDGVNWVVLATSTSTTGETVQTASGTTAQFSALRVNISATSGGTNPTIEVSLAAYSTLNGAVGVNQGTANTTLTPGWRVAEGAVAPIQNLTNATTAVTGTVADFGAACQSATFQVVGGAGVTAGAVTFFGSIDGTTFTPLTTASILGGTSGNSITAGVLSFTAAGNALISIGAAGNNMAAIRYFRADVTTNFVGGNVNCKVSAF